MSMLKVYSRNISDLEQLIFELSVLHIFLVYHGPFCVCGNFCELERNPKCTEYFFEVDAEVRESVIDCIKESELKDMKIVEELPNIKVHTAEEA